MESRGITTLWRWVGWIAAATPAILPLWLILTDGVDVHFWDEWSWAGIYAQAHLGHIAFADLFAQHNEHRLVTEHLINIALNHFTYWNNYGVLLTGWVATGVTSADLLPTCRRTSKGGAVWIWFVCNVLLFSPVQRQTWLWGAGVQAPLVCMFVVLTFVTLTSGMVLWLKLPLSLVCAAAATFTSANGNLVWPIAAFLIFAAPGNAEPQAMQKGNFNSKKCKAVALSVLALTAIFAVGGFLYHYSFFSLSGSTAYRSSVGVMCLYLLAFLGSPFADSAPGFAPATMAVTCGSILLILFLAGLTYVFRCWRFPSDLRRQTLPWTVVGGFALASALLAAFARAGFGWDKEPLETRYTTTALYLPVALVGLIPLICRDIKRRAGGSGEVWLRVPTCAATALLIVQVYCIAPAIAASDHWRQFQRSGKAAVLLINILPDQPDVADLYPTPAVLHFAANVANLAGFMHPPLISSDDADLIRAASPEEIGGAKGELDKYIGSNGNQVVFAGWAFLAGVGKPADAVVLTYQDAAGRRTFCVRADMGLERPDIVTKTGQDRYHDCGWQGTVDLRRIPPEVKPIRINAWAFDTDTGKAWKLQGSFVITR
ncbi:MAG: hypothetical protein ABSF29_03965 [Tepidisphaeraceae bacterium]|jgi:hypothetical protein